jgi:hypothetical protein
LAEQLERRFPAGRLAEPLRRLQPPDLLHYIRQEPLHTRAVQTAWQILAERILGGETEAVEALRRPPSPHSRHVDAGIASRISERLELLSGLAAMRELPFPGRLSLRTVLETFLSDPWAGAELQSRAADLLRETASLGESWLAELDPVEAIDLEREVLIVLIDGVPPDVWLRCMDLIEGRPQGLSVEWARLEAEPRTVPATAGLLDLEGEPLEALEARGVKYLLPRAREEERVEDLLGPPSPGKAAVLRLGMLDRGAHQGAFKLSEMASRLRHILETRLPALLDYCRRHERDLILTTDHGLSFTTGALGHGQGGVYERAIFRATWSPAPGSGTRGSTNGTRGSGDSD